jgi:hypothetical protein
MFDWKHIGNARISLRFLKENLNILDLGLNVQKFEAA